MISALMGADLVGILPNPRVTAQEGRRALCETLAINCSLLARENKPRLLKTCLETTVARRDEILSSALRGRSGELLVEIGDHQQYWQRDSDETSNQDHVYVPITAGDELWGTIEVRFAPISRRMLYGSLDVRSVIFFSFVGSVCLLLFSLFLSKALAQLDPSKVVPPRVREALDALSEGLLVIDGKDRIVLANRAFADTVGKPVESLQGKVASGLPWQPHPEHPTMTEYPWQEAWRRKDFKQGVPITLQSSDGEERTFMVNAAPIRSSKGNVRGVLASFDDVTSLENKRIELLGALKNLQDSRNEIQRQNQELQVLATRDPLTGCLNRRAFFEQFDTQWHSAHRYGNALSCILLDIDHFKMINDTHGHSMGDMVLRKVGAALRETARDTDIVCRYGGEEFVVVLPHIAIDGAEIAAERLRQMIAKMEFVDFSLTVSLGVTSIIAGALDQQGLLDQADQALYAGKNSGRNRWVTWTADLESATDAAKATSDGELARADDIAIPFHAVTGLLSALAYRDAATAAHSSRVAELCVAAARGLISVSDTYVVEMAALLHDIGKIGVPDAILLKPGPLTKEEWKEMSVHDQIGVEILRSSFNSSNLAKIVETHHAYYGGKGRNPSLPTGEGIPIGARLLSIADAYDAMVSDRVYRKGRSPEEAFEELRRCAGTQFDPNLVEHFIEIVVQRNAAAPIDVQVTSKEAALQIGLQIEQVVRSLDDHDLTRLASLAKHLEGTAAKSQIPRISEVAAELSRAATDDAEVDVLISLTHELLDLCRSTQKAYIDVCTHPEPDNEVALDS